MADKLTTMSGVCLFPFISTVSKNLVPAACARRARQCVPSGFDRCD